MLLGTGSLSLGTETSESIDGPESDGTVVVGELTASSRMIDAEDPPQLVQGAVAAGRKTREKIGRYDVRLWLQPATSASISAAAGTAHWRKRLRRAPFTARCCKNI